MTKTKHILGLSGGKDSAALAVHMNNRHPVIVLLEHTLFQIKKVK